MNNTIVTIGWQWFKITDLFVVERGVSPTKKQRKVGNTPLVTASARNNNISAYVNLPPDHKAGCITLPYDGSIGHACYQTEDFLLGSAVYALVPNIPISREVGVFICTLLRRESFRYNYGRKWNSTRLAADRLLLPVDSNGSPHWSEMERIVSTITGIPNVDKIADSAQTRIPLSDSGTWGDYRLGDLFNIEKGSRLTKRERVDGSTPYIGSSALNNGVTGRLDTVPSFKGGVITVPYNGSVGHAFFQPDPFSAGDDVHVLTFRTDVPRESLMFVATVIRHEKYRFGYGRKWHLGRMRETVIKLPSLNGEPDWNYMSNYMKGLPFSASV